MSKSKLKLGFQISSLILSPIILCYFDSTAIFRDKKHLMKNFKNFLFLPDMVREEEETSIADTRDDGMILEDVWVAEAKVRMCPIRRLLVTLVTGHLRWSNFIYRQLHGNSYLLPGGGRFGGRMMSQSRQFKGMTEPIGRSDSQQEDRIGWREW